MDTLPILSPAHNLLLRAAARRADGRVAQPGTQLAALVTALRRPQGATSLQLILATGWQPHAECEVISGGGYARGSA